MKYSNKKGVKNVVEQFRWLFLKVLEFKKFSLSSPKYSEPMVNFSFLTKVAFKGSNGIDAEK